MKKRITITKPVEKTGVTPRGRNKIATADHSNEQVHPETQMEGTDGAPAAPLDKSPVARKRESNLKPRDNGVSAQARRLFEESEEDEFIPTDFRTEVATNSLESQVGYSSLYRHFQHTCIKQFAYYRSEEGGALTAPEARDLAFRKSTTEEEALKELNRLLSYPIDDLDFVDLLELHNTAPRSAEQFWEMTKLEGREEFEGGHLAAHISFPVDYQKKMWNIAKYLGLRESFIDEYNPRGGIEISMIDMLAQSYFQFQYWMEQTVIRSQTKERVVDGGFYKWLAQQQEQYGKDVFTDGFWHRPMVSELEAIDHAAKMADRFHRIYVRTLKQMSDHRKYSPVKITNANQVNIATDGGQQINIVDEGKEKNSGALRLTTSRKR